MKSILFILFLTLSGSAFCQTSFQGKIVDAATGETLTGASISIQGYSSISSDLDGYFDFKAIKPGIYDVTCEFVSYETKVLKQLVIKEGELTFISIELEDPSGAVISATAVSAIPPATVASKP